MSDEQLALLGTKFWRADDDHTRSQPGTGLGYAITRALVEQMGGKIVVTSTVGEGSTFSFCIPIKATED
jgi:signal transduction histidine kinase